MKYNIYNYFYNSLNFNNPYFFASRNENIDGFLNVWEEEFLGDRFYSKTTDDTYNFFGNTKYSFSDNIREAAPGCYCFDYKNDKFKLIYTTTRLDLNNKACEAVVVNKNDDGSVSYYKYEFFGKIVPLRVKYILFDKDYIDNLGKPMRFEDITTEAKKMFGLNVKKICDEVCCYDLVRDGDNVRITKHDNYGTICDTTTIPSVGNKVIDMHRGIKTLGEKNKVKRKTFNTNE